MPAYPFRLCSVHSDWHGPPSITTIAVVMVVIYLNEPAGRSNQGTTASGFIRQRSRRARALPAIRVTNRPAGRRRDDRRRPCRNTLGSLQWPGIGTVRDIRRGWMDDTDLARHLRLSGWRLLPDIYRPPSTDPARRRPAVPPGIRRSPLSACAVTRNRKVNGWSMRSSSPSAAAAGTRAGRDACVEQSPPQTRRCRA